MPPLRISFDKSREWSPITLPGSKSIAARALICRYIKGADTELSGLPECDDTVDLKNALEKLSELIPYPFELLDKEAHIIYPGRMYLGNGGTTLRFILALLASIPGLEIEIDCGDLLRRRPLAPLIDALRSMGADIKCIGREGYPPLYIKGKRLRGGALSFSSSDSSQYLSAMLLASPLWKLPLDLKISGSRVSYPYIEMTRKVMEIFDVSPDKFSIEGDWSAAGYFYELALVCPGRPIIIENLPLPDKSIQGDSLCCDIMNFLGVQTGRLDENPNGRAMIEGSEAILASLRSSGFRFETDMGDVPDLVPALSVGLCLGGIPFEMNGIGHLRLKESDRLSALSSEMAKAGYAVEINSHGNALIWNGSRYPVADDETFDSWNDHRIVMALSIMAARRGWIAIHGAEAISKSFPSFFPQLANLGFNIK